ncbi:MAG: tetratricopeptide repeat protein [Phycisphaerales bacterium]|nr:MAG: tetratricopeptide repeat protein [Phycisphaerales bacterium]
MPEPQNGQEFDEAEGLFEEAQEAAKIGDFDRAIDRYMEGLRLDPDAVHWGHVGLRETALLRHSKGGEKPSPEQVSERQRGDTPLEQMLNAEYLLAKDPEHLPYAERMLKAAVAGGFKDTAKWIADLMFLANNGAKRPSVPIYVLLKDSYKAIGRLDRAFGACRRAVKLNPSDRGLVEELRMLSAELNARKAGQEQGQDFGIGAGTDANQQAGRQARQEAVESKGNRSSGVSDVDATDELKHLPEEVAAQQLAKAGVFFEKARKAAATKNYDYSVDMYLEGLRLAPDALREGHLPLGELALQRRDEGAKKPTMVEKMKRLRGKTPLEQMLNAEYLFTKDPDHLPYAEAMLKAAVAGGYKKTAGWIANLIFQTNNASRKPSVQTYLLLKDSYKALGDYDKAVAACQRVIRLKPADADLAEEYKNLTAELTMARGRYDGEGDFTQSIKDREKQAELYAQGRVVKTEDYRLSAVQAARKALAREPDLERNVINMADVLADLGTDEAENEAIELLEKTHQKKGDFSYKHRAGSLRIKQLGRKLREAKAALSSKPDDPGAKAEVERLSAKINDVELEHYRLAMENYPTDLKAKYEYGVRLLRNERYDEAIPLFQEAQKDPMRKISAMDKIGYCFFKKGWYADAVDVFTRALEAREIKDDAVAKELRYNLARSYEEQGDPQKALEVYRKIAQQDFAYRDVSKRVDKLRNSENTQ